MGVTFRDESNETSLTMIGYIDATVTTPNHLQLMRSKVSLAVVNCYGTIVVEVVL